MNKLREMVQGQKTNIQIIAAAITFVLFLTKNIDQGMATTILVALGFGTAASMAAKIDRAAKSD